MIKVFDDDKILAKTLALEILLELKKKKRLVLGCPGGRSLKKSYYYLGILPDSRKAILEDTELGLVLLG